MIVRFCFEGMEESGSEGLDKMLSDRTDTKFMKVSYNFIPIFEETFIKQKLPILPFAKDPPPLWKTRTSELEIK